MKPSVIFVNLSVSPEGGNVLGKCRGQMELAEAVKEVLGAPAFLLLFWGLQFDFKGFSMREQQLFEIVG